MTRDPTGHDFGICRRCKPHPDADGPREQELLNGLCEEHHDDECEYAADRKRDAAKDQRKSP